MTHRDLAELLRDHVAADEPPAPLPHVAVSTGRRRLRTRRLTAAGATLAVLAAAGAVVGPRLAGDPAADRAADPVSTAALEGYDALRMPDLMDRHVRRVLEASVPDLGPSRFTALDDQAQPLPERHWDKASILRIAFGNRDHGWEVSIAHSRSEAEGDPERYCQAGLDEGWYLDCTVERTADGDVVIDKLWALTDARDGSWRVVDRSRLARTDVADLWFGREVKVIRSETLLTYVGERVRATDRDPAAAAFATPVADLVAIGTDPELVMPEPPPGDGNGCPAWTLPAEEGGMDVACSTDAG